jgi:hypothetical protein
MNNKVKKIVAVGAEIKEALFAWLSPKGRNESNLSAARKPSFPIIRLRSHERAVSQPESGISMAHECLARSISPIPSGPLCLDGRPIVFLRATPLLYTGSIISINVKHSLLLPYLCPAVLPSCRPAVLPNAFVNTLRRSYDYFTLFFVFFSFCSCFFFF